LRRGRRKKKKRNRNHFPPLEIAIHVSAALSPVAVSGTTLKTILSRTIFEILLTLGPFFPFIELFSLFLFYL